MGGRRRRLKTCRAAPAGGPLRAGAVRRGGRHSAAAGGTRSERAAVAARPHRRAAGEGSLLAEGRSEVDVVTAAGGADGPGGLLVRPDGCVARACGPAGPHAAEREELRAAVGCWFVRTR
ncbi:hypothetical protein [Kitasatospora terrestris]|uniref:Uncharacterized protein n=1 Tax=Kitasatospora terrestris TaxID=258051 RepID=A0ABP9DHH1_9ACTN